MLMRRKLKISGRPNSKIRKFQIQIGRWDS